MVEQLADSDFDADAGEDAVPRQHVQPDTQSIERGGSQADDASVRADLLHVLDELGVELAGHMAFVDQDRLQAGQLVPRTGDRLDVGEDHVAGHALLAKAGREDSAFQMARQLVVVLRHQFSTVGDDQHLAHRRGAANDCVGKGTDDHALARAGGSRHDRRRVVMVVERSQGQIDTALLVVTQLEGHLTASHISQITFSPSS